MVKVMEAIDATTIMITRSIEEDIADVTMMNTMHSHIQSRTLTPIIAPFTALSDCLTTKNTKRRNMKEATKAINNNKVATETMPALMGTMEVRMATMADLMATMEAHMARTKARMARTKARMEIREAMSTKKSTVTSARSLDNIAVMLPLGVRRPANSAAK